MTMRERLTNSLVCAVVALIAGGITLAVAAPKARGVMIAMLIIAAIAFVTVLVLKIVLSKQKDRIKILSYAGAAVVFAVAIFSVLIVNLGNQSMYHPHVDEEETAKLAEIAEKHTLGIEVEEVKTAGGIYSGWRYKATGKSASAKRPVLLYFCGNGETASRAVLRFIENEQWKKIAPGCDVICFDYPGYGKSTGVPREKSMKAMAAEAYKYASDLETTSGVIVMGYSIGTGIAVYTASQAETAPAGLILLAPYNSGYDLYNNALNIFHGPVKLLASYKMPVYKYAGKVKCPTLIVASDADEVVPIASSRKLFSEFSSANTDFVTVEGKLHNDLPVVEKVTSRAGEFVKSVT